MSTRDKLTEEESLGLAADVLYGLDGGAPPGVRYVLPAGRKVELMHRIAKAIRRASWS